MRKLFYVLALLQVIGVSVSSCSAKIKSDQPNIIVILVDDMGYSDLGCTGSEIETPNLDAMAKNGVLFTNCYNTSRCCPSRASLLTGQYQWDAGIGHMDYTRSNEPEYQGYLNKECATIAELLKLEGYQTFMSGKWHVGHKKREMWPDYRGFDQFYGTPSGGGIYFYPSKFYDRPVYHNGVKEEPDSSWYSTDAFTDYSIDYIKNRRNKEQPFFMYMAYIAPHFPLQAKKKDIKKYKDTYKKGYDFIRQARFEKQKRLQIVDPNTSASEPVYTNWENVEDKENEALKMSVYAAMVDCLDQNVGKLMQSLKEEGIDDNTVILFLSDNGGCPSDFNKTPDTEIGNRNSNATYGIWYNVSNTPYRMGKRKEHEGGIITPLIVHWPNGISKTGLNKEPLHITDIMPTCLQLAGGEYPKAYKGVQLDPLDGKSLLPLLHGKKQDLNRVYYWEHEGNRAVRKGNWKLVALKKKPWELYNLADDPYEQKNLAINNPKKYDELRALYKKWANAHGVKPWPLKKKKKK
ncbi:arylsulfatase [Marinifilum sp.]|uniref:arylsulfatase n=1 Tax=Marinifilum sp. TaxID=2033137 RepID=UPI003BAD6616